MPDITLPNHGGMSLPKLVNDYHEAVRVIASFGSHTLSDRREAGEARGRAAATELTRRGWILDPEVAFNAAYFEVGVRQAKTAEALPVGNTYEIQELVGRTAEARAAVLAITQSPEFDFACNNPAAAGASARCSFSFTYYTRNGELHSVRMGRTGRQLQHVVVDA